MSEKIIQYLLNHNAINDDNLEIYQYGINLLIKKVLHIITIIMVGILFDNFWGIFLFLVSYTNIREYAGGYHAKSALGCYICTFIVSIMAIVLLNILEKISFFCAYVILFSFGIVIWKLSPVESANNKLSVEDKEYYLRKVRRIVIIYTIIAWGGFFYPAIINGILAAWCIQCNMLMLGKREMNLNGVL